MSTLKKKTVQDINVTGKRVIARMDFNVPLKDGVITDDKRIREAMQTIKYLSDNGAKTILVSHLGRPKGEFNVKYSLAPVAKRISELLGKNVVLAKDVIGPDAKAKAAALKDGDVMLLENVRFHEQEEKNDPEFAKELATMADIFVNDAFGTAHRAHASTAGLADYLPSVCGFLIEKEINFLGMALENPERPFLAIIGGAKVSDKIGVIESLIDKVDTILIGGGMSYTFLKAQGKEIGTSICELDKLDLANELVKKAAKKNVKLLLPVDFLAADAFSNDANTKKVGCCDIPSDMMGLDIGEKTIELFRAEIMKAKTIIWNGPLGVSEFEKFANGTRKIAQAVAESGAISIIGGGDSAAAVELLGFADKVTHISTGGGASLEFLEGKVLPGIDVLEDK